MARAKALCMCKTCGYEFEHIAYRGNSKDARSYEKWASENIDECPSCREERIKAEREKQNRISAEAAQTKGWPELTGTEKQVAWATSIREKELGDAAEECTRRLKTRHPEAYKIAMAAIDKLVSTRTKASWWIDNRGYVKTSLNEVIRDMKNNPAPQQAAEEPAPAKADEATIAKPESQTHDGIVDIRASEQRVSATYQKDDDFRSLLKGLGYRWNVSEWSLNINYSTGSSAERAAELGNKLLNAGFAIRIQDAETLRNAIAGNYKPMHRRWVGKVVSEDKFIISWAREDDLYSLAKRLPGARYVSPSILVPAKEWEAVLDFADAYDFRLSPGAQELIKKMQGATITVQPAAAQTVEYDEHPVEDVLKSSRDIIPDLKD